MKLPGVKAGLIWPLLLIVLTLLIAFVNYVPGTFLTGWDTLHPEFNFPNQISNIIFGVWRADQGLGAVAAHSHMSELPRVLMLWLGSWLLPLPDLRYIYIFACLLLGPLGVYYFLENFLRKPAAFLGALFYIFNLGTVQHFYVPFEMFPVQYAALGWLFLFAARGNLKLFILTTILALPMAYAPLLWYAYFGALVLFILSFRPRWGLALVVITILVNAFWLLPNWYFLLTHARDVPLAKMNQMFSEEAFLKNKEFGNLADLAVFKNFLFDWEQNSGGGKSEDLLGVWKLHLNNPLISAIGYCAAVLVAGGVALVIKEKKRVFLALLPMALIAAIIIINMNPPLGFVFGWIRDHSSVFRESLRFPFTKFSLILMFTAAAFFAVFWEWLLAKTKRPQLAVMAAALALIIYGWPMFKGFLIDPAVRLSIPQEYFQAFTWFNQQPADTRVAPFPINSTAGWEYTSWGYQGPGFFWFGVKQAFLARDFDRWIPANENYYWEISQAVYSRNLPLLESVLNKYRVNWLLVDGNIVNPPSAKALYVDELEQLIKYSDAIRFQTAFGKIRIYGVRLRTPGQSYISLAQNLPGIGPTYKWGNLDQAYFDVGDYRTGSKIVYPYRSLFSGRTQADLEFDPASIPAGEIVEPADYPTMSHRDGYLVKIIAKNISGRPYLFWIDDWNSRHAALETYLVDGTNYFVLPPMEPDGIGYTFHFDENKSQNKLEFMEVRRIDYWGLVKQKNINNIQPTVYPNDFIVDHPNPAVYRVDMNTGKPATLILAQSYDPGWVALGAGNHVLINNWANGWELTGREQLVYLVFWPQLLEFAGFGLLGAAALALAVYKFRVLPGPFRPRR